MAVNVEPGVNGGRANQTSVAGSAVTIFIGVLAIIALFLFARNYAGTWTAPKQSAGVTTQANTPSSPPPPNSPQYNTSATKAGPGITTDQNTNPAVPAQPTAPTLPQTPPKAQ